MGLLKIKPIRLSPVPHPVPAETPTHRLGLPKGTTVGLYRLEGILKAANSNSEESD